MDKPDGSELKMTLLRSLDWLEERRGKVGRDIDVNLAELGAAGPATVLAIEPCPPIEAGTGRVVTGTFQHSAANVIDLYVTREEKPIGTTANHPFWSETRKEFVQAGSLQPGEELRTATGQAATMTQLVSRPGIKSVFNLEVDAEHVYAVASLGVIVHNSQDYDIHRIGGGSVENLRPKPAELKLVPPGISVLKGGSPSAAANQMKAAFPKATRIHELAKTVGSTTEDAIRNAGFDIMPNPTDKFENHFRLIHPNGVAGFVDENLARLSNAFKNIVFGE